MPLPEPTFPLDNGCSVLFNNTLYAYTPDAFQTLPITQGARWKQLPSGVSVKGGVCVKSTPKDENNAALYIVGGTAASSDYPGLQRFKFAEGKWETIQPTVQVTQNRVWHSAVYLNASDSILVYAGSQDGTRQPSSQTFTIKAFAPYAALAYEAIAPPAVSPLLMPWSEDMALYIGGSDTNKKAMLFSAATSWVDSGTTLDTPLYNTTNIRSAIINGDDGSKSLYTFDMSVSPNSVNRTILQGADGKPVQNAKPVNRRKVEEDAPARRPKKRVKRADLTIANWPAYNGTLAPSVTRTGYSIAQDPNGLVVISGGNEDDVLCMFKARENTWINATATLAGLTNQRILNLSPSSTSNSISPASETGTPTSTASTTTAAAAAAANKSDPPFPVKILGAVLGSILGVALILVAILFLLRCARKRREHADLGHQRRSSGIPDEKDGMDFSDRGLPPMSSATHIRGHAQDPSQGSFSSMAIFMGRVGHKRGDGNGSVGSGSSSQFNKQYKTAISKPIPQESTLTPVKLEPVPYPEERMPATRAPMSRVRGSTRRSSGWNRYWSGGSSLNILGFGSKRATDYEDSERDSASNYSENHRSQVTQHSAFPPPLKLPGQPELNTVASRSPTINPNHSSTYPLTRAMSGQIERANSFNSVSSYNDDRHDAFSSGIPASVHEQNTWTPVDKSDWSSGRDNTSSMYSESVYPPTHPRNTQVPTQDMRFPVPPSTQRTPRQQRDDMSWLNLGNEKIG
ncbi:Uncharacterized protein BP5553_06113 [Venustampulla echinocandica]|uniref:Pre-mRNA splicing factor CLF1 n=1 Tax=Venustampulla echinocandica TaxID=2656787 RepID=A0A370TML7_9HELO|nr:Uncharacterized protein BP5553_06113 [Venustampulla echinocandica]RDL36761.1 Uncharacterized protein BP5553_06113 [Venustampulla echinocandica]